MTISLAPTNSTKTMLKYRQSCISGEFSATIRSALVKSLQILSDALPNLTFSYSSREKPLTTRMPRTFSSMDSFILSYFLNTARKAGSALRPIRIRPKRSTGTMKRKVAASGPPITKPMTMANRNISGALTAIRITIMKAIWVFTTSVVIRVTSEAEEKRSIFSKEKACTRLKISCRRFLAKPAEAFAAK